MNHPIESSRVTIANAEPQPGVPVARASSPAAMAWLDRSIRRLIRTSHPQRGMEAASEARDAARALATTLGTNEVPFPSVERRIEALVRLDVPENDQAPLRRHVIGAQLLTWASEAYHEARLRLRRPDDLR